MSQVKMFAVGFKEAGIGGRFSKFNLHQEDKWFSLSQNSSTFNYCFEVKEVFHHNRFEEIPESVASNYKFDDQEWVSHFNIAKEVLRLVCKKRPIELANTTQDNRYYIDRVKEVVYVTNRSHVIACMPAYQQVPMVSTNAALHVLTEVLELTVDHEDYIGVFLYRGRVSIALNDQMYHTGCTPTEFELLIKD